MEQFVKAAKCFKYFCEQYSNLFPAKFEKGLFVSSEIRSLMKDENF